MPAILLRVLARMLFTKVIKKGIKKLMSPKKKEPEQLTMPEIMEHEDTHMRGGMK